MGAGGDLVGALVTVGPPVGEGASGAVVVNQRGHADRLEAVGGIVDRQLREAAADRVAPVAVVPDAVGGVGDRAREDDGGELLCRIVRLEVVDEGAASLVRRAALDLVAHREAAHRAVDKGVFRAGQDRLVVGRIEHVGGHRREVAPEGEAIAGLVVAGEHVGAHEPHLAVAQIVGAVDARGRAAAAWIVDRVGLAVATVERADVEQAAPRRGRARDQVVTVLEPADAHPLVDRKRRVGGDLGRVEVVDRRHRIGVADQVVRGPGLEPHPVTAVGKRRCPRDRCANQVPGYDVGVTQNPDTRPAVAADQVAAPFGRCADLIGRATGRDEHAGPGVRGGRGAIGQDADGVASERDARRVERHASTGRPHDREGRKHRVVTPGQETKPRPAGGVERHDRRGHEARSGTAVDRHRTGDAGQRRPQGDRARHAEVDLIRAGCRIGLQDGGPQRSCARIGEAGD